MKKIIAFLIAMLVVVFSALSAGAQYQEELNQVLDETVTIKNGQVMFFTHNITKNNTWKADLISENEKPKTVHAKDCVDSPSVVYVDPSTKYALSIYHELSGSGEGNYNYGKTGGTYQKVRIKLSQYDDHFNEDGSHTKKEFTFRFGDDVHIGEDWYASSLVFISGGAVTFTAPDENGYVEFYVTQKVGGFTQYDTDYSYRYQRGSITTVGGGGGVHRSIYGFTKGAVSGDTVCTIKDVTSIQLYIAKRQDLSSLAQYRADADSNGEINVLDATKVQLHLAKVE